VSVKKQFKGSMLKHLKNKNKKVKLTKIMKKYFLNITWMMLRTELETLNPE
jgi:hypothetical protein